MKKIPVSGGRTALVDDRDFEQLNKYKWYYYPGWSTGYAYRQVGSRHHPPRHSIFMHREILRPLSSEKVDHISGDGLDNRRSNLRLCNDSSNAANSKLRQDNTSGYKGVFWCPYTSRWRASITYQRKQITVARFDTKEEAAMAYAMVADQLFGDFARTS